ncbi:MAG: electron transfer flavoprotein subunit beta/FixA family protein [Oscillospiraceae bacterium]|nr:electron transfer flavoprotein subunit beta/FixA family protein [Oscillospiraceae bacterium]
MNIAVFVKMVPVSNAVSVDPVTHVIIRDSIEGMMNPADLNAIEEAVQFKEKTDGQIVVFTMGPPTAESVLRVALSMGCDKACLITDKSFAGGDTIATSKVLARSLQITGSFDLLITGASSSDGATGQVGPMIAEYLGIGHISDIQSIQGIQSTQGIQGTQSIYYKPDMGATIKVEKKQRNMIYRLKADLPVLLTVKFGCNTPRLPTLRSRRDARDKPLSVYTNKELKMCPAEIGLNGSPTIVAESFTPERTRRAAFLSGNPREMANTILNLINIEKERNGL